MILISGASKTVSGHVLDVAKAPLLAALRRFDPQLYVKWNPKKLAGQGCWELRRAPELKSAREGRFLDSPTRGRVFIPGDIFDMGDYTLCVPKPHETSMENHVKDFKYLTYDMLSWVSSHDLWSYGYRGKNAMQEAEYKEGQYLTRVEEAAVAERTYMIKQHRTQFNDFRSYISSGGNPARLLDYWDKK